jgi:hypothetical protein
MRLEGGPSRSNAGFQQQALLANMPFQKIETVLHFAMLLLVLSTIWLLTKKSS